MQMKRVVVFLPPAAVKACDSLADRYGSNRSEVVRLAVAEGMPAAVEALQRLRGLRLVEEAGAGASRLWRARGGRVSVRGVALGARCWIRTGRFPCCWTTGALRVRRSRRRARPTSRRRFACAPWCSAWRPMTSRTSWPTRSLRCPASRGSKRLRTRRSRRSRGWHPCAERTMPSLAGAPGACGQEVDCAVASHPGTGR